MTRDYYSTTPSCPSSPTSTTFDHNATDFSSPSLRSLSPVSSYPTQLFPSRTQAAQPDFSFLRTQDSSSLFQPQPRPRYDQFLVDSQSPYTCGPSGAHPSLALSWEPTHPVVSINFFKSTDTDRLLYRLWLLPRPLHPNFHQMLRIFLPMQATKHFYKAVTRPTWSYIVLIFGFRLRFKG